LTNAVVALVPAGGITKAACAALGVSRASVQRRRARLAAPPAIPRLRPRPVRALTAPQQQVVLDLLHTPRFADQAPAEIYASLLDEGVYHCSTVPVLHPDLPQRAGVAGSLDGRSRHRIPPARQLLHLAGKSRTGSTSDGPAGAGGLARAAEPRRPQPEPERVNDFDTAGFGI